MNNEFHSTDIDLDFANRDDALTLFKHHPASIIKNNKIQKHASGVYVTPIPIDPSTGYSTIDHKDADRRGYFKLDFLNVHVYDHIRDDDHLTHLSTTEPNWERVWTDRAFCEKIIHINNYFSLLQEMKPDSIPRMAMFLSVIRPAKSHLRNKSWAEIKKTVWEKPADDSYYFKQAHACSYSLLVAVHINLLEELENATTDQ